MPRPVGHKAYQAFRAYTQIALTTSRLFAHCGRLYCIFRLPAPVDDQVYRLAVVLRPSPTFSPFHRPAKRVQCILAHQWNQFFRKMIWPHRLLEHLKSSPEAQESCGDISTSRWPQPWTRNTGLKCGWRLFRKTVRLSSGKSHLPSVETW